MLLSLTLFIFFPSVPVSAAKKDVVTHVVVFWLQRPGNVSDQNALIRGADSLREIDGVLRVDAGRGLPVQRRDIEQTFDVCVVMTFRDRDALARYETNPRHREVRRRFQHLIRRTIVFNASAK